MNAGDIAEMFIRAAETEAKLPQVRALRQQWGGYCLAWVHELADINARGKQIGDRLLPGDDPLEQWRMGWLEEWGRRPTAQQISNWEGCIRITTDYLTDPGQRRALWAWAMSQAGCLYRPGTRKKLSFARWCRDVENIAELTGHRRKNRAIGEIMRGLRGKPDLHDDFGETGMLPNAHENGHVFATIEGDRAVYDTKPVYSWRDDPSFTRKTGMTLQEWRAAKRRLREARKRKAA